MSLIKNPKELNLSALIEMGVKPEDRHFDGTVFTMGQLMGLKPIPLPGGVYKIFYGGDNIVIGPDEEWFLFKATTKLYLETIRNNPEMKERLENAKFLASSFQVNAWFYEHKLGKHSEPY